MTNIKLDSRLSLAASMVKGNYVADIGTDHAYIPIYLIKSGKCSRAIAADINKGPLDNAKENAEIHGVFDSIVFYLCDGLSGIDTDGLTDVVICGMGGELMAKIIEECPSLHQKGAPRLILQPMSAIEDLRLYLSEKGFLPIDGGVTECGGKLYQCFSVEYTGIPYSLTWAEALVGGKDDIIRKSSMYSLLLDKYISRTEKEINGKKMGGLDTSLLEAKLSELIAISKEITDEDN